ncbi:MAG TPA: hypothetical protein VH297_07360 [Gaiellaceae bacterium]|jgi:hypothetical protein
MSSPEKRERLWSFRDGMVGSDDSVKGFEVEASDGHAGKVAWASYAPGESYLVVSLSHHLRAAHHVVPAGAVERISADERKVWTYLGRDEIAELPEHHDEPAPLEGWMVDAIDRATATRAFGGDLF